MISFFVPGEPRPQPRPRFDRRTGRVYSGEHKSTRSVTGWRHAVALKGVEAMRNARLEPMTGPLSLELEVYMPRPTSHHVANDPARPLKKTAPQYHTTKPDRSNLEKAIEDALNGVTWADDSQVVDGPIRKLYARSPEEVGALITIRELETA